MMAFSIPAPAMAGMTGRKMPDRISRNLVKSFWLVFGASAAGFR